MDDKMDIDTNIKSTLQHLTELYFDHKYEDICNILNIEHNPNYNNENIPIYKYNKNEDKMVFYDNENFLINTRVYVDEETKYVLNTLIMITSNSINEKNIIDLIIDKWTKKHATELLNHNNIPKIVGNEFRIHLKVGKNCWEKLIKICKIKNISSKCGFKMSLLNYFEEICNNTE